MCFYLLDVRIPKKVANIFKKIISDKNTPEVVQNFYDYQVKNGCGYEFEMRNGEIVDDYSPIGCG